MRPVTGVGRYDGTTFTGVGCVNTNHGGVLTISTAPTCLPGALEGGPEETRGGFMVQPWYHVAAQGEAKSQVMVVRSISKTGRPMDPAAKPEPGLEGTAPLFDGCINLSKFPDHPENSFRAQIKIDDGPWEQMPKIVGKIDNAFTPEYLNSYFAKAGSDRKITKGVTAIRLLFPEYDPKLIAADLAQEVIDYLHRALKSGAVGRKGHIAVAPARLRRDARMVTYYVDGHIEHISNIYPFDFDWDTTTVMNGFHGIDIETLVDPTTPPIEESSLVFVEN